MTGFSSGSSRLANPQSAFTFIELVVVVGMLGLLIALLFPALAKVQRQARMVTCLTNLRELEFAYGNYARESSIRLDPTHQNYWLNLLRPSLPDANLFCPEAGAPSYGWGDAQSAWGPFEPARNSPVSISFVGKESASYGFNGWLYEPPESFSPREISRREHGLEQIPVFGDANFVEGFPQRDDPLPMDIIHGARSDEPQLGRFCIARHGQSINVAFLDGHAELVPLPELSNLRWLPRAALEHMVDASSADPTTLPSSR